MNKNEQNRVVAWRLKLLRQASDMPRSVAQTCRHFGLSRKTFYKWRARYKSHGEAGLCDRPRVPQYFPKATPRVVISKILYLRDRYHFGPGRTASYLQRFHHLAVARSTVHRILIRYGMNRLPANQKRRPTGRPWKRYEKPQPGHRVQVDVKFLERIAGSRKRLYQFTAIDDVREVCNYLDAIKYARGQLKSARGLPIATRLLNETHRRLMRGVRGANKQPGEIRHSQNWIGGTRPGNAAFVPAPPEELPALLTNFEKYLHAENGSPPLVRIGLAHAHFETIHPYLDGNGRIGRLLITLLLEHWKQLSAPLLYLSLFFKRHRAEYYRLLGEVRANGDWESWMNFFLEGVATIADEAVAAAREVFALISEDRQRLLAAPDASVMSIRLIEQLPVHPVVTILAVVKLLKTTKPTAGKAVQVLENLGVLAETSGKQRDRSFAYAAYLEKLRAGTEIESR